MDATPTAVRPLTVNCILPLTTLADLCFHHAQKESVRRFCFLVPLALSSLFSECGSPFNRTLPLSPSTTNSHHNVPILFFSSLLLFVFPHRMPLCIRRAVVKCSC